jgi:hypothetical protein
MLFQRITEHFWRVALEDELICKEIIPWDDPTFTEVFPENQPTFAEFVE